MFVPGNRNHFVGALWSSSLLLRTLWLSSFLLWSTKLCCRCGACRCMSSFSVKLPAPLPVSHVTAQKRLGWPISFPCWPLLRLLSLVLIGVTLLFFQTPARRSLSDVRHACRSAKVRMQLAMSSGLLFDPN